LKKNPVADKVGFSKYLLHRFLCTQGIQFKALKEGDRFFFTHRGVFTRRELDALRQRKLANIICANSNLDAVPADPLRIPSARLVFGLLKVYNHSLGHFLNFYAYGKLFANFAFFSNGLTSCRNLRRSTDDGFDIEAFLQSHEDIKI